MSVRHAKDESHVTAILCRRTWGGSERSGRYQLMPSANTKLRPGYCLSDVRQTTGPGRDILSGMSRTGKVRRGIHEEQFSQLTLDVMLPFYGDPVLLRETVASVQAQTDESWRLFIIDDGYPDPDVARWFATLKKDPRIEYHRNSENLGANGNYSRALSMATADLVTILGADDRLLPDYVKFAKATFQSVPDSVVMYQPGVQVIDGEGRPILPIADRVKQRMRPVADIPSRWGGPPLAESLLHGNWTYFPSICWRREPLQAAGFRVGYDVVQDFALILDLIAAGHDMVIDPNVSFEYRRHGTSDSAVRSLTGQRFAEERALFSESSRRFAAMGWDRAARAARLRATSRMNALTVLPAAVRGRQWAAVPGLLNHAFSR